MLAELEIIPIGTKSVSLSRLLAEAAKLIDASGLAYRAGPMGTVVEGEWDDVMRLAKACHDALRQATGRVVTTIRIDDRSDVAGARLAAKVQSLERAVGRPLKR
jgi:uncharacterized protein (TIGR00106 family)